MSKFKVGDKITSHKNNGYLHTGLYCECVITAILDDETIVAKVIKPGVEGRRATIGRSYHVKSSRFVLLRPRMEENE